ncbi:uncharacterized protein LOC122494893 isoform X4 [Prionailurus bengalensis]|uniref:uncharacterized protein LOC122494893 isoform X4 n=1 Tax=Prionailurus bengalensis TaxID=37029 RepID=UPI001CA9C0EF|nr:uncharacterized protein LOC122494893 isoform X4 [Prionailurus bengalensis]
MRKLNESLLPATRNVLAQTVTPAGAPTMPAPPPGLQAAHRVVIIPVPVCHPSRTLCSLNRSPWAYSSLVFPEPSTSPRSQRALSSTHPLFLSSPRPRFRIRGLSFHWSVTRLLIADTSCGGEAVSHQTLSSSRVHASQASRRPEPGHAQEGPSNSNSWHGAGASQSERPSHQSAWTPLSPTNQAAPGA